MARRRQFDDDDDYDDYDDYERDDDRDERPRRSRSRGRSSGGARRSRRSAPAPKAGFFARLFGGGAKPAAKRGRGRISFDDVGDDGWDEPDEPRRSRRGRPSRDDRDDRGGRGESRRPKGRGAARKLELIDLCKPVIGYVGVLPGEEGGPGPDFLKFREGVVAELQKIEPQAREHGIEPQDAQAAMYALALFLDEQVLSSGWEAKVQWAAQPLSIALLGDPEGGVNFFRKLEGLREDQTEVMKIYLFCLALGYRGMYITEDVRKREATIEKIKKDLHRRIGERAMESMERLFPDAYTPSEGVEDEVEPPPAWWVWASVGVVIASILLWILLYWLAGRSPQSARDAIDDFALAPVTATSETEGSRC